MIRARFRPWGNLTSIISGLGSRDWSFIGCVSMEDRCTIVRSTLSESQTVINSMIFRVRDADSRYTQEIEAITESNQSELLGTGVSQGEIKRIDLLGKHGEIGSYIQDFLENHATENLIIDISSLPKKIFFLLIRKALEDRPNIQNILVTYAEPESYCSSQLAENPEGWKPLPGFLGPRVEPSQKALIIGLGFEPLGLPELYSSGLFNNTNIRLLFPFPASPKNVSRNWDFARLLEPLPGNASSEIDRVDSLNIPDVFDKLLSITGNGEIYSILAPFGPKPMSLAMCLFASACARLSCPPSVYYTQPTIYNPHYSQGVKYADNIPAIHAYCVKLNGSNLYTL